MARENETRNEGLKRAAPFGLWESEVSKEAVFRDSRNLESPRVCRRTGRAFFTEARPDGNVYIVELKDGECKDVLPPGFSARSRVYEYGGSPYAILPGARIIFSNFKDNSVNILDVDTGHVKRLLHSDILRYAEFDVHPSDDEPWVLAVEEDHQIEIPEKVRNYVVAINSDTGEVKRIVQGDDFYMFPSFSHDGKKISWVEWDFPRMPWVGVKLFWADWMGLGAALQNIELVAGSDTMSVTEPRWGPDGYLYYGQEQTNYFQLYRRKLGERESTLITPPDLKNFEFGRTSMACGCHSYTILSNKHLVASYTDNGSDKTILIDLETFSFKELPFSLPSVVNDGIERLSDNSFLIIGSTTTKAQALYKVDISGDYSLLRNSTDQDFSPSVFSVPEHIQFPAKNGTKRIIHGFYWAPHNPRFEGPKGEKPPLIVHPHGGPTGHTKRGLKLSLQYWITRGYATFAINYSGSTGHGREYRELLNGNWGVIDVDDVAESVKYLAESGRVDGSKVGIRGGSAGGYTVLQALCCHPEIFAGGVSMYGISEVKLLLETTHKMEARYVDMLMFTDGMSEQDKQKVMKDRSPVYRGGNITAPLLLLHGEEDNVVPISQAYTMYEDIKGRGGDVRLVTYPGEGHGFRKAKNELNSFEEEEAWWRKTLVKT